MVMHLSVRLVWHDRGWDGTVCDAPKKNVFCVGRYSVRGEVIRGLKDTVSEEKYHGKSCYDLSEEELPPCTETINVYGKKGSKQLQIPPDFLRTKQFVTKMPSYSVGTWPFELMWDENGNVLPAEIRERSSREFFEQFDCGRSLVFFYLNYDNMLNSERRKYVIVGISRLGEIGDPLSWREMPKWSEKRYGNLVWSRTITHSYPDEGVIIPYHDYLRAGKPIGPILFEVGGDLARRFKWVCREISDDDVTILVMYMIGVVKRLKVDGVVKEDWDAKLRWLNKVLSEVWRNRGLFPGLGSVLEYLDFPSGTTYVCELLAKKVPDLRAYVFDRIGERKKPDPDYIKDYEKAIKRWKVLPTIIKKLLKERLCLFELSPEQVRRILGEKRIDYSIVSDLRKIYENPYCVSEEYQGEDPDDTIPFHRIDNGMMPPSELKAERQIDFNDDRRIRAMMVHKLKSEMTNGHTYVFEENLFDAVRREIPNGQSLNIDKYKVQANEDFYNEKLAIERHDGKRVYYLRWVKEHELQIAKRIEGLISRKKRGESGVTWKKYFKPSKDPRLLRALNEQTQALENAFQLSFTVISGAAGTGKTTAIEAFVKGVREKEGKVSFLLLAPTGKAAVRLLEKTGQEAMTIHRILMKHGWISGANYALKQSGGGKIANYQNIIIDEASTVDLEVLGTLFKAIEWNVVKRFILVGDQHQLPPIGVGKPFSGIISFLKLRNPHHLNELTVNCRQIQERSYALKLAALFTSSPRFPGDEEILNSVAKGGRVGNDLEVYYWKDESDFDEVLMNILHNVLREESGGFNPERPYDAFNEVLNLGKNLKPKLDRLQILSPYRGYYYGVDENNVKLQDYLRKGLRKNRIGGFNYLDKVIQVVNRSISAKSWIALSRKNNQPVETYIPNGALGWVDNVNKKENKLGIIFDINQDTYIRHNKKSAGENIELAYVISIHKAQGSEFDTVILIIPKENLSLISRELIYTALTRSQKKLILLLQADIKPLLYARWSGNSAILQRKIAHSLNSMKL